MHDDDEIRLPDGRTLRFRRERDPRGGLRASTALSVTSQPNGAGGRRPADDATSACGRHLDILA